MPSAAEFSANPDSNTTIGGINIGEGCSPAGINNVERYLAAAMRSLYDQVQGGSTSMPVSGGAFTGAISRQGQGAFLNYASASSTNGQVYVLPAGSPRPAAAEGVMVFYY